MKTRRFGSTGVEVPIIGQGTWQMGGGRERAAEVAALRRGIELGMTHIDTAEMYGDGKAEEMIAEVVAGVLREKLFVVSKVLPRNASRKGTVAACEASLRRLRMDHLDVYLLHWPSSIPIGETMAGMEDLVKAGKIRWIGVSNFDVEQLDEARAALTRERLVCNQVLYHLGERAIERRLVPHCREHDIAVVGYSPFGSGNFPGKRSRGWEALHEVARRHGCTERQVALAFLTREEPLFAIPKASSPGHVEENAGAGDVMLTEDDISLIHAAFPVSRRGGLPTL